MRLYYRHQDVDLQLHHQHGTCLSRHSQLNFCFPLFRFTNFRFSSSPLQFRQMAKALPAVLEEVFTYNPFCKSIEEVFSFLYEIDERYEHLIKNCAETTQSRILYTYFNTYIQDIEDVIDIYRDDPSIIFSKFEFVIICLNEFYRKITGNFYPYVKDTALFTKYMDNHEYKKNNSKTDDIKYIEEFIKYIRENVDKIDVIEFIQELYDLYSINNFYISCFYVF